MSRIFQDKSTLRDTAVCAALLISLIVWACEGQQPPDYSLYAHLTWPNEPTGFARIAERGFSAIDEYGWWYETRRGRFDIVRDTAAPASPQSVGRMTYPAGFPDGREPANIEIALSARPADLYLSFWVKFSANWQGHSSGTNKILFVWTSQAGGDDESKFFFKFEGTGNGTLVPAAVAEQIGAPNETAREFFPNVTDVQVFRGQWHRIEIVLRINTPGLPNGVLTYWVDGTLVGQYTDVRWNEPRDTNWSFIQWAPTWGGYVNQTLTREQYQYMDHLYVSAPAR
jgi:hypothetical protein